ncbi:transporter substrate-binding domain-containing protein [Streptomyces bathyalis]|uniref:Transporter substrate-binding domain-containing protein n=1 Tax=Streptomyces bathyalis TaxID=2710756 RepID=A0A7T1T6W1_9ACTN|nr:transporter substrate-binding domain-containing protein [Streptomyces bathyalis]QPP07484.1 transporter substrate-binding domain-containing protein [Streptomyces bathyalis]
MKIEVMKGLPGFSTRSSSEYEYAGFDIALSDFLASRLDFEKYAHDVPAGEREQRLIDHDADLAIATYTVTDARDEKIDFTAPYLKTYQGVLVGKDNTDINKVADLEDKRVCSAEGSTTDPNAARKKDQLKEALGAEAKIGLRKDYKTCVKELRSGNFEAVWTDKVLLEGFAQTSPYSEDVKLVNGITIENRQFYAIGIREGHEQDCRKINDKLEDFLHESWRETFRNYFPGIAGDQTFEQQYKPTEREFKAYRKQSCGKD